MYTLNSDNVSYVVPMDYIDLGYLRRNIQIGDTVKPLWTPQHQEYSQFQLKAWRKDTDDENRSLYATTMCHICNIAVPVICLKEHNNSNKHKNFLKIIHEALQRVKNNMNADVTSLPTSQLTQTVYFCETCCMIIPKKEKDLHINSIVHRKFQKQDEVMQSFSTLYEKDYEETPNDSKIDDKANDTNNNCVHKKTEPVKATQLELMQKYISSLSNKFSSTTVRFEVMDENYILIKIQGSILKVHIDAFNSFSEVDEKLVCLLCGVPVTSRDDHMWTDKHLKNVFMPLWDEHCIRQVNQNHAHCIICNQLISDAGIHKVLNSNHKNKLKNAQHNILSGNSYQYTQKLVRKTEETVPKLPENKIASDVPHLNEINNGNKNTQNNVLKDITCQSNKNLVKRADETVPVLPENKKNETNAPNSNGINKKIKGDEENDAQSKYVHYLMCDTPNPKELLCRVCLRVIPAFLYNINGHIDGKSHIKKYEEYLSINKLQKVKNGFACDYCRLHVPEKTEVKHVSSETHKANMEIIFTNAANHTYCETCYIYIDTHNFENHRNGQKHKLKATSADGKQIVQSFVKENKNYAEVAATSKSAQNGKVVPSTSATNSVNSHELKNVQLLTNSKRSVQIPISDMKTIPPSSSAKSVQPKISNKLNYQLKQTPTQNILLCKVCNVPMPNIADNITTHINGRNHKTKYNVLLKSNCTLTPEICC